MKKTLLMIVVAVYALKGLGEDVQKVGSKIEDKAEAKKK